MLILSSLISSCVLTTDKCSSLSTQDLNFSMHQLSAMPVSIKPNITKLKVTENHMSLILTLSALVIIYFIMYHVICQEESENRPLEQRSHNIPDHYLPSDSSGSRPISLNKSECGVQYPAYFDIKFNNFDWQVLER